MTLEQMVVVIVKWFSTVGGASLKLPSGWFGRPYDNFHRLTGARVLGNALLLELDDRQELSVSAPQSVHVEPRSLSIVGSEMIEWRWLEYGSNDPHAEVFDGGDVEFLAA